MKKTKGEGQEREKRVRHWMPKAINGYLNIKLLCSVTGQFNKNKSSQLDFSFTSKFLQKRREYNAIHKSINARYSTIHTNLQMVIYTVVYTHTVRSG